MNQTLHLSAHLQNTLRNEEFAALCIVGPIEVIPRKFGDNQGGRPIKFRTTKVWEDKLSSEFNNASPYVASGLLFRVWTLGIGIARKLELLVRDHYSNQTEPLRKDWLEMSQSFDPQWFEFEIRAIADMHRITAMSDHECVERLKEIEAAKYRKAKRELHA